MIRTSKRGVGFVSKRAAKLWDSHARARLLPGSGACGSGKTTLARLIHRSSARGNSPFVDVNCAGFTESLLESELFGYERYAFTGAGPGRGGLFQAAHRGVLLLDEIGEMSIALQARLL